MTASIVEALALARAFALVLGSSVAGTMPPDLSGYPNPRVVLTQDASSAVLWWDATPWVERLMSVNTPRDATLRALEVEAVKLFVTRAPALPMPATRLRIVVVFAKSGMVTGPYRTNTREGVQTLLLAEGSVRPGMSFASTWEADAKRGVFPVGLTVTPAVNLPQLPSRGDGAQ